MKKLLVAAMMVFGLAANAQEGQFNVGANFGLPLGDSSDYTSFAMSAEVNYLFSVSDDFKVGPSVSYLHYIAKDAKDVKEVFGPLTGVINSMVDNFSVETTGIEDSSFLPIAVAARYNVAENFTLGADLGYAVGISPKGNDGGFYYRPMVGYNISEKIALQATYAGVSKEITSYSNISLGVMFAL
ncbi:outer membrane beta-barrel protein [Tenacibaculum sp. C7A-26P2]|uniref:outer membrane beta-barrel protein n=1 Tax=Tenacibaculum sp. C7A-26P2 TaxID=3447504 RepID=UPI003F852EF5